MARVIRKKSKFEYEFERFQAFLRLDDHDEPIDEVENFRIDGKPRRLTRFEKSISTSDDVLSIGNLLIKSGGIY